MHPYPNRQEGSIMNDLISTIGSFRNASVPDEELQVGGVEMGASSRGRERISGLGSTSVS